MLPSSANAAPSRRSSPAVPKAVAATMRTGASSSAVGAMSTKASRAIRFIARVYPGRRGRVSVSRRFCDYTDVVVRPLRFAILFTVVLAVGWWLLADTYRYHATDTGGPLRVAFWGSYQEYKCGSGCLPTSRRNIRPST